MTLIERLRGDLDMLSSSQMHALGKAAADEIEKLQAALRAARPFVDQYHGQSADPVMEQIDQALKGER